MWGIDSHEVSMETGRWVQKCCSHQEANSWEGNHGDKTVDTGTCCGGKVNNQVQMLPLVFNAPHNLATTICSNLNLHFTPIYTPLCRTSWKTVMSLFAFPPSCLVPVSSIKCFLYINNLKTFWLWTCSHNMCILFVFINCMHIIHIINVVNISKD